MTSRKGTTGLLNAAVCAFLAIAALPIARAEAVSAQSTTADQSAIQAIELGQTKGGSFPVTPPDAQEAPYHEYRLRLEQGWTVRIGMESPDPDAPPPPADQSPQPYPFDTYLELRLEGIQEPLRTDDDSGEGLNSRIVFTAPSAGTYLIRARPLGFLSDDHIRTYRLSVDSLPPPPPPGEFRGSRIEGDLGPGSPEDESYEPVRYAAYWFEGRAQERVQFDMESSERGPSVQILDEAGAILNSNTAYDSNRVRVASVLPATARYLVRVQAPASLVAHFSVNLTRAMASRLRDPEEIDVGDSRSASFALDSNASPRGDGSGQIEFFYQLYQLELRRGEVVTAIVNSSDFAPVLEAGTTSVLGFSPVLHGMGGEPHTSRLVIQPFEDGTAVLRVRTPSLDVGAFELRVLPGAVTGE